MAQESYTMKGGDGTFSYSKNSTFQKTAADMVKDMICEVITKKLDIEGFLGAPKICVADLGCSVGPNTFIAMQNVIDTIETKYKTLVNDASHPQIQFQVFFNDYASNDFNTLFASLPPTRNYFAAGVPGSFYGRLFPDSSLHFVHSSYALQWMSSAPEELLDKGSSAWNGGRIHYSSASQAVVDAYAKIHSDDMELFLEMRAQELAFGGVMVLLMPCVPHLGTPHSQVPAGFFFDLLEACLLDMVKGGLISEGQVDSFNLPIYSVSLEEIEGVVEKNGRFNIERIELSDPTTKIDFISTPSFGNAMARHMRAGMEGLFANHFGIELMDDLFDRFSQKVEEFSEQFKSCHTEGIQLFLALVRRK